jgi:aspartate/tyrosine/aromatic aminotransferase
MSLFDSVVAAPADPILGLTEAFKADPRPEKINLGVGVFVDETGKTPVLEVVHAAEERLLAGNASKSYLPITGIPDYAVFTQKLCFGEELLGNLTGRLMTAQTPGGTGALRVAADFMAKNLSCGRVHLSNPTWANHKGIFAAAGLELAEYAYFSAERNGVDVEAFLAALDAIPAGDIVVLHACCHNPTGADLTPEQWKEVAAIAAKRGWIPFLDFAYQGFGDGIDADAVGVRTIAATGLPCFVAHSFSKNFGLYQERVGALHVVTESPKSLAAVSSQVKVTVRVNYSNPPAHGGAIVATVLGDAVLTARWADEVAMMRDRINGVRRKFVDALKAAEVGRDFEFLLAQRGMFSFTGLSKTEVERLRDEFAVFMVGSGRINVAGITDSNRDALVKAFKTVIG